MVVFVTLFATNFNEVQQLSQINEKSSKTASTLS